MRQNPATWMDAGMTEGCLSAEEEAVDDAQQSIERTKSRRWLSMKESQKQEYE